MEQFEWLMEAFRNKSIKITGYYKIVNYTYEHSLGCIIDVWCKTYEKCGEDTYDYEEIDDDRRFQIKFKPDGSIREIKEI